VSSTWMGLAALLAVSPKIKQRIELSRAKHRSLAGHSRMAKRLAANYPRSSAGSQFERAASLEAAFWLLAMAVACSDCWWVATAESLAASIRAITVSPPPSAIAATEALIRVRIKRAFRVFMFSLQSSASAIAVLAGLGSS